MGNEKQKQGNVEEMPLGLPSDEPVKREPTPERAREEKQKQEEEAGRKGS